MKSGRSMRTNKEFIKYLKSRSLARSTIRSAEKVITIYQRWLDRERLESEQATYNDLLVFIKQCSRRGASQRTIQQYLTMIRHYYDHLQRQGNITANPVTNLEVKGVRQNTLYHILEPHELHRLYHQHQDDALSGKRNQVMLGLLVYQGLRTQELKKLEVSHVKLREGKIDIPGGKRSNGRVLQLQSHQVMDMYDYLLETRPQILRLSGQQTERLLVSPEGGINIGNFMVRLLEKLREIDPTVKNARQIRASVITKWLKQYNLRQVQYLAGHRYISSTEKYKQNDLDGLIEEINQYHPMG